MDLLVNTQTSGCNSYSTDWKLFAMLPNNEVHPSHPVGCKVLYLSADGCSAVAIRLARVTARL